MSASGVRVAAIQDKAIDTNELLRRVTDPACGAVVTFYGVVRDLNDGRKVLAVSYDAFAPLAERTLQQIAERATDSQARANVAVVHRTGRLAVGEISVAIVVSTPHRAEAYSVSRAIIEAIKHELPVWKQEHYEDGDSEWLKGCSLRAHA